jgi:hypothetical protein
MSEDDAPKSDPAATPPPSWLERKLDVRALRVAVGADLREFALLWLVFALLDMLMANRLTTKWAILNGLFSLVMWSAGAYIELRRTSEET